MDSLRLFPLHGPIPFPQPRQALFTLCHYVFDNSGCSVLRNHTPVIIRHPHTSSRPSFIQLSVHMGKPPSLSEVDLDSTVCARAPGFVYSSEDGHVGGSIFQLLWIMLLCLSFTEPWGSGALLKGSSQLCCLSHLLPSISKTPCGLAPASAEATLLATPWRA